MWNVFLNFCMFNIFESSWEHYQILRLQTLLGTNISASIKINILFFTNNWLSFFSFPNHTGYQKKEICSNQLLHGALWRKKNQICIIISAIYKKYLKDMIHYFTVNQLKTAKALRRKSHFLTFPSFQEMETYCFD